MLVGGGGGGGAYKISNMSNNVCQPPNTSSVGRYKSLSSTEFSVLVLSVNDLSVTTIQWNNKQNWLAADLNWTC